MGEIMSCLPNTYDADYDSGYEIGYRKGLQEGFTKGVKAKIGAIPSLHDEIPSRIDTPYPKHCERHVDEAEFEFIDNYIDKE